MTDEVLLEEETSHHTRWWVQAALDRDTYDLFIVRYGMRNGEVVHAHYYQPPQDCGDYGHSGGWFQYDQGEMIHPAYRFPGDILHVFANTEWVNRSNIEEALKELAATIFAKTLTEEVLDAGT